MARVTDDQNSVYVNPNPESQPNYFAHAYRMLKKNTLRHMPTKMSSRKQNIQSPKEKKRVRVDGIS